MVLRASAAIRLGASAVVVLNAAATVEAFRIGRPVLGVVNLLAIVGALSIVAIARRPTVELRSDLAAWTARTSAATGEPEGRLVDRAVAHHRALLDGPDAGIDDG